MLYVSTDWLKKTMLVEFIPGRKTNLKTIFVKVHIKKTYSLIESIGPPLPDTVM